MILNHSFRNTKTLVYDPKYISKNKQQHSKKCILLVQTHKTFVSMAYITA